MNDHHDVIISEDFEQFTMNDNEPDERILHEVELLSIEKRKLLQSSLPSLQLEKTVHFSSQASISIFTQETDETSQVSPTKHKSKRFTWKSIKKNKYKGEEEKQAKEPVFKDPGQAILGDNQQTLHQIKQDSGSTRLSKNISDSRLALLMKEPEFKLREHDAGQPDARRGSISDQLREGLRELSFFKKLNRPNKQLLSREVKEEMLLYQGVSMLYPLGVL